MDCSHGDSEHLAHMHTQLIRNFKYGLCPKVMQMHSLQSHNGRTKTFAGHLAAVTAHTCHPITHVQPSIEISLEPDTDRDLSRD